MVGLVGAVSLGCDKNRVDTENILTSCANAGFRFCDNYEAADVLLVNTCAFLSSAREEAIDAVLEAAAYKKNGACRLLVVSGCLPMRYLDEIKNDLPEVDLWLLPESYGIAGKLIADKLNKPVEPCRQLSRLLTTPAHYAYLKIADGCSNHCTFCMIPSIRGAYRSRSPEEIVAEATALVKNGVKELILVAQDVTRYGDDHPEYGTLAKLLPQLTDVEGLELIRLLYCYPERITDELIAEIKRNDKVAKYLDIPLQHASNSVLKRMNRRSTAESVTGLIARLRQEIPHVTIRTTMMVGFPGETEEDVDSLCAFLKAEQLDRVGFFVYSKEEDTPSAKLPNQVPEAVKRKRLEKVAATQQEIAFAAAKRKVGSTVRVRYEDVDYDKSVFVGRPRSSAPDIDPIVTFSADYVDVGKEYDILITDAVGYDLHGKLTKKR